MAHFKDQATRQTLHLANLILACMLLLPACSFVGDSKPEVVDQARGVWRAVSGDLNVDGHGLYGYNCYYIESQNSDLVMTITWDTGFRWWTSPAIVKGQQLHVNVRGIEGVFTIHDNQSATVAFVDTVTFEDRDVMVTKDLVKMNREPC